MSVDSSELLLVLLGFGVDVPEDVDVRKIDSELAEQRGHSEETQTGCVEHKTQTSETRAAVGS